MSALNTIVHAESRSRSCSVRKTSATPASPVRVATRICSMYLDFGAASCANPVVSERAHRARQIREEHIALRTLSLVAPFTDFSKLPATILTPADCCLVLDCGRMKEECSWWREFSKIGQAAGVTNQWDGSVKQDLPGRPHVLFMTPLMEPC